jgi:hypothetical protein
MLGLPDNVTFPHTFQLYESDGYYQYFTQVERNASDATLYHFSVLRGSRLNNFELDLSKPILNFNLVARRWATITDSANYAMKTLAKYPGDVIPDSWKDHVLKNVTK